MADKIWLWGSHVSGHGLLDTQTGLVYTLNIEAKADYCVTLSVESLHNPKPETKILLFGDQAVAMWIVLKDGIDKDARPGLRGWMASRLDEAQQAMTECTAAKEIERVEENGGQWFRENVTKPMNAVVKRPLESCPDCGHALHDGQVCRVVCHAKDGPIDECNCDRTDQSIDTGDYYDDHLPRRFA